MIFSEYLTFPEAVGTIFVCFSCSVLLKYDLRDQAGNTYNIEYVIGGHHSKLSFSDLLVITQLICGFFSCLPQRSNLPPKILSHPLHFCKLHQKNQWIALNTLRLHYMAQNEFCSSFYACVWRLGRKERECHYRWYHLCVSSIGGLTAPKPSLLSSKNIRLKPSLCYPFNNTVSSLCVHNVNSQVLRKKKDE